MFKNRKRDKVTLVNKLAYGSGNLLGSGALAISGSWLLIFYTKFVAGDATSENSGSLSCGESCAVDLQTALNFAPQGSIIELLPGTMVSDSKIEIPYFRSGSKDKPITVKAVDTTIYERAYNICAFNGQVATCPYKNHLLT